MSETTIRKHRSRHDRDRTEYSLYFALAYPFFLMGTIARKISRIGRPQGVGANRSGSIFAEAAEMAHSVLPWMFMGR
ncbi:MAG: hypothetical protein AAGL18_02735 [Pseudomonadota bacterium]